MLAFRWSVQVVKVTGKNLRESCEAPTQKFGQGPVRPPSAVPGWTVKPLFLFFLGILDATAPN